MMSPLPFAAPRLKTAPARRRRRGLGHGGARSGLAALEFALMAPVLSALFIGTVDASQLFMAQLKLSAAVGAGADYAMANASQVSSTGGAGVASAVAAVVGNLNGTGWASGTVVVNNGPSAAFAGGASTPSGTAANADLYYCMTGSPGAWNWGTGSNSATSCGAGEPVSGKFVTISATTTVNPLIAGLSFTSGTVSQSIAVQVQ
jgi:Flp pilus assembly protein TadG